MPDNENLKYGEGEIFLGKIISNLTIEQKQEIEKRIRTANSVAPDHLYSDEEYRKHLAFIATYGHDEWIKELVADDRKGR